MIMDWREEAYRLARKSDELQITLRGVNAELEQLKRQPDLSEITKWVKVLTEQLNVMEEKQTTTNQYDVWDRGDVKLNLTFHNRSQNKDGVELLLHKVEKLFGDAGWTQIEFEAVK